MSDIVIVAGARTPMGGFQGSLAGVSAVDLGAVVIREACSAPASPPRTYRK
ncbi:putative acyl-CoA thiolase [Pseudomonas aeruginosa PA38182]|nr:putative acyl-CoA thiolase [Pseudomonas aeruginosa PA38182]